MKKSYFRPLAIVLAVIMMASFAPTAFAAEEDTAKNWLEVPSLKDTYAKYFDIGNITSTSYLQGGRSGVSSEEISEVLKYHNNVISAENDMKPLYMSPSKDTYEFAKTDVIVEWAEENDLAVHGHTLVWHSQSPNWLYRDENNQPLTRAEAKANMEAYITNVAGRYAGRIASWDVVNEVFDGGTYDPEKGWQDNLRKNSPWYLAYANGTDAEAGETVGDYIYDAFVFARLADPAAVLYINDFNDHIAPKRDAIPVMANEFNEKWKDDPRNTDLDRPLVEGVGMQAHYWSQEINSLIGNVKRALDNYTAAGLRIIVTELDIPASTSYSPKTANDTDIANQIKLYGDLFELYQQYDAIERVTFWGMKDDWSWRSGSAGAAQPLPFGADKMAKGSYYAIIDAYNEPHDASELLLTVDKTLVTKGEYFDVTSALAASDNSNAASLTFTFDPDKFLYRGFEPAEGVTVFNTVSDNEAGTVTFMLGDLSGYNLTGLVIPRFSAREDIDLKNEDSTITATVDYVSIINDEKVILSSATSLALGTIGVPGDTTGDGEVTLIDLSNIIDWFGIDATHENWGKAKFFDFNSNGTIDIFDISTVASLIK